MRSILLLEAIELEDGSYTERITEQVQEPWENSGMAFAHAHGCLIMTARRVVDDALGQMNREGESEDMAENYTR